MQPTHVHRLVLHYIGQHTFQNGLVLELARIGVVMKAFLHVRVHGLCFGFETKWKCAPAGVVPFANLKKRNTKIEINDTIKLMYER